MDTTKRHIGIFSRTLHVSVFSLSMRINHLRTTSRPPRIVPVTSAFLFSVLHEKNPSRGDFRSAHSQIGDFHARIFHLTQGKFISWRLRTGAKPNKKPSHLFQSTVQTKNPFFRASQLPENRK
jgi:hypothetical protein